MQSASSQANCTSLSESKMGDNEDQAYQQPFESQLTSSSNCRRQNQNIPLDMEEDILVPGRLCLPWNVDPESAPDFQLDASKPVRKPKLVSEPLNEHLNQLMKTLNIDYPSMAILRKTVQRVLRVISEGPKSTILHVELIEPLMPDQSVNCKTCVIKLFKFSFWPEFNNDRTLPNNSKGMRRHKAADLAESAFFHLRRMKRAGLRVPSPIAHKQAVLFMSFLCNNKGEPWPQLKNVKPNSDNESSIYLQTLDTMRIAYESANLAYTDVCDTNILVDNERNCWLLSAGTEIDRGVPHALALCQACMQLEKMFVRRGVVDVMSGSEMLYYISGLDASNRPDW